MMTEFLRNSIELLESLLGPCGTQVFGKTRAGMAEAEGNNEGLRTLLRTLASLAP